MSFQYTLGKLGNNTFGRIGKNDGKGKLIKWFTLSSHSNKAFLEKCNHYIGRLSELSQIVSDELHYTTIINALNVLSLFIKKWNQKCFAQGQEQSWSKTRSRL